MPYEVQLNRQIMGLPPIEQRQNEEGAVEPQLVERNAEGGVAGFLQTLMDVLDPDEEDEFPRNGDDNIHNGAHRGPVLHEQEHIEVDNGHIFVDLVIEEVGDGQMGVGAAIHELQDDTDEADETDDAEDTDDSEDDGDDVGGANANRNQPPHQGDNDAPADGPPVGNQHEAPQAPPARRIGLGGLLSSVSNSIVGALLLPAISFVMGEALRLVLPKSWTAASPRLPWAYLSQPGGRPGLLQQQWGRSLIGGGLFVVLNDALRVYSKSRKVAAMQNRRVKNVERKRR